MSSLSTNELPTNERVRYLQIARDAAKRAAQHVHSGWRRRPDVEYKGSIDLVTRYDRESEALIRAELERSCEFSIVGEEHESAPADFTRPVWYVDPIDGTTNYVHGHPFYCVSLGLWFRDAPVLGVVHAPALGVEWTTDGTRAYRNGEAIRVSEEGALSRALLATGFPYDRATSEQNNFAQFIYMKRICQGVRRCGSAALDLCLVADGTYDGYWEMKLKPWDLCAGAAIVNAAGGVVSDFNGARDRILDGYVIASNGKLHESIRASLSAA